MRESSCSVIDCAQSRRRMKQKPLMFLGIETRLEIQKTQMPGKANTSRKHRKRSLDGISNSVIGVNCLSVQTLRRERNGHFCESGMAFIARLTRGQEVERKSSLDGDVAPSVLKHGPRSPLRSRVIGQNKRSCPKSRSEIDRQTVSLFVRVGRHKKQEGTRFSLPCPALNEHRRN